MYMRAMVLEAFGGTLKAETRRVPEPGPVEALVRVVACGAGLTLESIRLGHLGGSTPRIMGHEYSGTVVALGAGVEGWQEGDRVTGSFYLFCGNCVMCASGKETLCLNNKGNIGRKRNTKSPLLSHKQTMITPVLLFAREEPCIVTQRAMRQGNSTTKVYVGILQGGRDDRTI